MRFCIKLIITYIGLINLVFGDDNLMRNHTYIFVFDGKVIVENKNIKNIEVYKRKIDEFYYSFSLDKQSSKKLYNVTKKENIGKTIDVYMDGEIVSSPHIINNIKNGNIEINSGHDFLGNEIIPNHTMLENEVSRKYRDIIFSSDISENTIKKCDNFISTYKNINDVRVQENILDAYFYKATITHIIGNKEDALKAYSEAIEVFEKSNLYFANEQNSKAMFEKASILFELYRYNEALKVYEDFLLKFENAKNPRWRSGTIYARNNVATILDKLGRENEAIEIYKTIIDKHKNPIGEHETNEVIFATISKMEINLIFGNGIDIQDYQKIKSLSKKSNNMEMMALNDMFYILNNAKSSTQDKEIKKWLIKYKNTKYKDWSFDELEEWIANKQDINNRIKEYVSIFKKHLYRT